MAAEIVLTIVNGAQAGAQVRVAAGQQAIIGRSRDCELVLSADGYISRRHFRVSSRGREFVLEDVGSSHGTVLNGQVLTGSATIKHKDRIRAGQTDFDVQLVESGEETALPTKSSPAPEPPRGRQPVPQTIQMPAPNWDPAWLNSSAETAATSGKPRGEDDQFTIGRPGEDSWSAAWEDAEEKPSDQTSEDNRIEPAPPPRKDTAPKPAPPNLPKRSDADWWPDD